MTYLQVAQQVGALDKNYVNLMNNVSSGFYALTATMQGTAPTGLTAGTTITLTPPSASNVNCAITDTGPPPVSSNPVLTINHINADALSPTNGQPDEWIIRNEDHGACYSTVPGALVGAFNTANGCVSPTAIGCTTATLAGWTPSGSGWGATTFTVTLNQMTPVQMVLGNLPLQRSKFNSTYGLGPLQPIALGGGGLYDDITANAIGLQPVPCTAITTCLTQGTKYGGAAINNQFLDPYCGSGVWSYSPMTNQNCSYDGEHLNMFGQALAITSLKAAIDLLIPYP
jgi:hypothetical protein